MASYSLFALFGICAVLEAVLTVLGLRGGPFDTQKRRWVGPLLGAEIILWVLLLICTSEYFGRICQFVSVRSAALPTHWNIVKHRAATLCYCSLCDGGHCKPLCWQRLLVQRPLRLQNRRPPDRMQGQWCR